MKKGQYILESFIIDFRENLKLSIFSVILSFVGLFFLSNVEKIKQDVMIFSNMEDVAFLSVNTENCSIEEIMSLEKNIGFSMHIVEHVAVNLDGEYAECYLYDDYIMENVDYYLEQGSAIKNENEVILSSSLKDNYKIGDSIVLEGYDKNGQIIEKKKTVCGFLKYNTIFYPHGYGDKLYELMIVDIGNESEGLYYPDAIICKDSDLTVTREKIETGTYLIKFETESGFDKLQENVTNIGYLYSGKEFVAENRKILRYERNQKKVFVIAGFTLGLSVFMGSIYISIMRRMKEYGIMMLTGASFYEAQIIMHLPEFVFVGIGTVIGEFLAYYLMKSYVLDGIWNVHQVFIVFLFNVALYGMCCVLVSRIWKNKNIVDLLKRG